MFGCRFISTFSLPAGRLCRDYVPVARILAAVVQAWTPVK